MLTVGDTIYKFDGNRRIYAANELGAPIYREHWTPVVIVGETSRSWLVGEHSWQRLKVDKKTFAAKGGMGSFLIRFAEDLEAVEQDVWMHDHRYNLVAALESCRDFYALQKIAELLGYDSTRGK